MQNACTPAARARSSWSGVSAASSALYGMVTRLKAICISVKVTQA
jgi:hypothetical protein